jgi:hypothetical protein
MLSQFVLSPKAKQQHGVASHVVGAMFFFLLGAIVVSALYPHVDVDRRLSDSRGVGGPTPAPTVTVSGGTNAFSQRDSTEYTGGPIPQPTFDTTQAVAAVAAKETPAAANGEKPDHTASKPMRKQEYSHRHNATQNRQYREQPSYEAARRYWNPWDWGNQRQGQFVTWR